jgi:cytochrome P450
MSLISSTYDPTLPDIQRDPYPAYRELRASAPVYFVESLGAFAVSRHADVRRVMHDHESFSSAAMAALVNRPVEYSNRTDDANDADLHPPSIIGTDGEYHKRLRMIVNRGFTPRRVAVLEDRVRDVAGDMIGDLVAARTADLQDGLAVPLPVTVIAELLGVPAAQRDDFRRWSEDMVRAVFEPPDRVDQEQVARSSAQMSEWLDMFIDARHERSGDDLVSVLLRAELEGGALTRPELTVFVFTLLIAGSITTAYLIGRAVEILASDSALQSGARAEMIPIAGIVEETLRYDAQTQMMFREATRETEIAGVAIPQGATLVALLGSANRDERVFEDADRFDPTRDASEHLTFGHGSHFCLGASLARLEARVTIEELVRRAPQLELAGEVEHVASLVFRGPTRLPLRYV